MPSFSQTRLLATFGLWLIQLPMLCEAQVVATDVSPREQLASAALLDSVRPTVKTAVTWPSPEDIAKHALRSGFKVDRAKTDSVRWMRLLLQGRWIPSDLEERMIALDTHVLGLSATGENLKWDAVMARYSIEGASLQVTQTSNGIYIVFRPQALAGSARPGVLEHSSFVAAAILSLFNDPDELIGTGTLTGRERAGGITWGVVAQDFDWRHCYTWYSDGVSVILLMPRVDSGSGIPPDIPDWF